MGQGTRTMQSSDSKPMVLTELKKQQEKCAEGSKQWIYLQEHINRIVAQNYLEYVNS